MPTELRVASNAPTRGGKGRRAWISIDLYRAVRRSRASVSPRIITLPIQSQRIVTTDRVSVDVWLLAVMKSKLVGLDWERGGRNG
jgi:hypothetical protein